MTSKINKSTVIEFALIILVLLILGIRTAGASGGEVDFESITLQADPQQVDIDGDGRPETISANYTVFTDGTATGQISEETHHYTITLVNANIAEGPDNTVIVTAMGTDTAGEQHIVTYTYDEMGNTSEAGDYGLMLFDTSSSMTTSYPIIARVYTR